MPSPSAVEPPGAGHVHEGRAQRLDQRRVRLGGRARVARLVRADRHLAARAAAVRRRVRRAQRRRGALSWKYLRRRMTKTAHRRGRSPRGGSRSAGSTLGRPHNRDVLVGLETAQRLQHARPAPAPPPPPRAPQPRRRRHPAPTPRLLVLDGPRVAPAERRRRAEPHAEPLVQHFRVGGGGQRRRRRRLRAQLAQRRLGASDEQLGRELGGERPGADRARGRARRRGGRRGTARRGAAAPPRTACGMRGTAPCPPPRRSAGLLQKVARLVQVAAAYPCTAQT